jgi:hypothetical protein
MQFIVALLKKLPLLPIGLLLAGLLLGVLIGWSTADFTNATPYHLRPDLQEDYLRMAIDSYAINGNQNLAVDRWKLLGPGAQEAFIRIQQDPRGIDQNVITAYGQLIQGVLQSEGVQAEPQPGGGGSSVLKSVAIYGGIAALTVILIAVGIYLRRLLGKRGGGEVTPAMQAAQISKTTEKTNYEAFGIAPPVTQTLSTYVLGDDLYDESFPVDSPDGKFLGEFGASISHAIGVGDTKRVTALEVWLYDQGDIETSTKVLLSEYAYNDEEIRTRLQAKGEIALIDLKEELLLETKRLQLLAKVLDFEYGTGALPPKSFFQRVTLELTVWYKGEQPTA